MSKIFIRIIPGLTCWGVFLYIVFTSPYPDSLTQTNLVQAVSFFIPLFLAITFTINLFLKRIILSSTVALGLIFLLILKALDSLNFVTGSLIVISVGLLISYFKKARRKI